MIDIVVLGKLVPDTGRIPDDAWDRERGTLKRERLLLQPNPCDDRALGLALFLRTSWDAQITYLSMGPEPVDQLCVRALAYGADRAILLSDTAFAGSDTLATARTLAHAIRTTAGDPSRTLVIAGIQSTDGDTGQVPVQIAALLDAVVVPFVTSVSVDSGQLQCSLFLDRGVGTARLGLGSLPAVVTCTDRLPSLPMEVTLDRLVESVNAELVRYDSGDLGLSRSVVGLSGSPTRVIKIETIAEGQREPEVIEWQTQSERMVSTVIERMAAVLEDDRIEPENRSARETAADQESMAEAPSGREEPRGSSDRNDPAGAVWVIADPDSTRGEAGDHGLISAARRLADELGVAVAVCRGAGTGTTARLAVAGATVVVEIPKGRPSDPVAHSLLLADLVERYKPVIVLIPASIRGRVLAPYLAARLGAGLTADCTEFRIGSYTVRRKSGKKYDRILIQIRPALGGNVRATIVSPANVDNGLPQMATARPWAFPEHRYPAHHIEVVRVENSAVMREVRPSVVHSAPSDSLSPGVAVAHCRALVSVGQGVGKQTFVRQADRLAELLRLRYGVSAEVSASRPVVDSGVLPRERQVGQTGTHVRPDLYFAFGISGAIQHRVGMQDSGYIVAVNTDPDAPIRHLCDLFVVGQAETVMSELIERLESDRSAVSPTSRSPAD
jgi:electron transfer flavoprotein alpha subunit